MQPYQLSGVNLAYQGGVGILVALQAKHLKKIWYKNKNANYVLQTIASFSCRGCHAFSYYSTTKNNV